MGLMQIASARMIDAIRNQWGENRLMLHLPASQVHTKCLLFAFEAT